MAERKSRRALNIGLDAAEFAEQALQSMRSESPIVVGLIVEWERKRHRGDEPSPLFECPAEIGDGDMDFVDVLEHVEAQHEIVLLLEIHRSDVENLVSELGIDVGLAELSSLVE